MKKNFTTRSKKGVLSFLMVLMLPAMSFAQMYNASNPPPATPPSNVSNTQDRDQMCYQLGITFPTNLPARGSDPNRPPDARPNDPNNLEGDWTDSLGTGNTIQRGGWGLWNNYRDDKVGVYSPLDLLKAKNGTRITTPDQWTTIRRPEILKDVQETLWGVFPADSILPRVTWTVVTTTGVSGGYPYIQKVITGTIDVSRYPSVRNKPKITATLMVPANAKGKVPVMIVLAGASSYFNDCAAHGWGVCGYTNTDLQPDNGAGLTSYLVGLVNKGAWRKPNDWGSIGAWVWGISKLVDYFETDPNVDATHIGVSGHSRYGKTTIAAMAFDPRIFISFPSCAGSLGYKIIRRNFGQTLENSAWDQEYHWMSGNMFKYCGPLVEGQYMPRKLENLPIDGYHLLSLCAPRPVFGNSGNGGDTWQDYQGAYMSMQTASPVWNLFGKKGLITNDPKPIMDSAYIQGDLAFRWHNQGHVDSPDWPAFWRFASKYINVSALKVSTNSILLADSVNSKATFDITADTSWTIQKPAWLNLSIAEGRLNKTITITASSITALDSARIDTVTVTSNGIKPLKIVVTQPTKNGVPRLAATPNDTVKVVGTANDFKAKVSSNTMWTVTAPSWVTASPSSGGNSQIIALSVAASTDTVNTRIGKVLFKAKGVPNDSLYVNQAAGTAPIPSYMTFLSSSFSANPTNVDIGSALNSTASFWVQSNVNVARTCSSSATWLTASIVYSFNFWGNEYYTVNLKAIEANSTAAARTATVTVKLSRFPSQTITVTQAAASSGGGSTSTGSITLSKSSLTVNSALNSTGTFNVTSDTTWTITSSQPWITPNPTANRRNGTITLTTGSANPNDSIRTAVITATIPSGTKQTVTVYQTAINTTLNVSVPSLTVPYHSYSASFAILSDTAWTISSSSWLAPNMSSGINTRTFTVNIGSNPFPIARTGIIKVTAGRLSKTITITQDGLPPSLYIQPVKLNFHASMDSSSMWINTNGNFTISSNADWITPSPKTNVGIGIGTGAGMVFAKIKASANTTNAIRTATVTVTVPGLTPRTFTYVQDATTGTNDVKDITSDEVTAYPNPVLDVLYVKLSGPSAISLFNAEGQLIVTKDEKSDLSEINMSGYKSGMYILKIVSSGQTITKKVVKQ